MKNKKPISKSKQTRGRRVIRCAGCNNLVAYYKTHKVQIEEQASTDIPGKPQRICRACYALAYADTPSRLDTTIVELITRIIKKFLGGGVEE